MEGPIEVSVDDAAARRAAGALFVDVREPWETAICSIEDSLSLPMSEIAERAGELPSGERELVVVCHKGMRSLQVAMWLRSQGFAEAASMAGGIEEWARSIEPGMARY